MFCMPKSLKYLIKKMELDTEKFRRAKNKDFAGAGIALGDRRTTCALSSNIIEKERYVLLWHRIRML